MSIRTRRARDLDVKSGTAWLDIGHGECQVCGAERRMYRPVDRLDVHVCAPCSQVVVTASIQHTYGEGGADDWWEEL